LAEEDTGGQERDPGEVVRWRIRCSPPAASAPPTHPNLLISTQRCLSHIAPGNGYSQTVTLCPQMDPPPISPSPIPPPGGWAPLVQRGEGKTSVSWEGEKRVGLILTIRQDGTTRPMFPSSQPRGPVMRWGCSGGELTPARVQVGSQPVFLPNTTTPALRGWPPRTLRFLSSCPRQTMERLKCSLRRPWGKMGRPSARPVGVSVHFRSHASQLLPLVACGSGVETQAP